MKNARRLEPEGGTEVPEVMVVSGAVGRIFVDLVGESRREHVEAKLSRREKEAPGEEEVCESSRERTVGRDIMSAREYLEQVKCCHDTDCNERMMEKGLTAKKMEIGKNFKILSEEK